MPNHTELIKDWINYISSNFLVDDAIISDWKGLALNATKPWEYCDIRENGVRDKFVEKIKQVINNKYCLDNGTLEIMVDEFFKRFIADTVKIKGNNKPPRSSNSSITSSSYFNNGSKTDFNDFSVKEFSYCTTCIPFYLKELESSTMVTPVTYYCSLPLKIHDKPARIIDLTVRIIETNTKGLSDKWKLTNDSRRNLIRMMKRDLLQIL